MSLRHGAIVVCSPSPGRFTMAHAAEEKTDYSAQASETGEMLHPCVIDYAFKADCMIPE